MREQTGIELYRFSNYRSFLLSYYEHQKAVRCSFSYNSWARSMGVKSATSLIKVVSGQRDAGTKLVEKIANYFSFDADERFYFDGLVKLAKYKSNPALSYSVIHQLKSKFNWDSHEVLDEEEFALISKWWFYAIRQLARLKEFPNDPSAIAQRLSFRVPTKEIKKALKIMQELGLMQLDEKSGKWKILKDSISSQSNLAQEALKQYHEQLLDMAKEGLRRFDVNERMVVGCSTVLDSNKFSLPQKRCMDFIKSFTHEFETSKSDRVYQVQIQLFPLSKKESHEKKHPTKTTH